MDTQYSYYMISFFPHTYYYKNDICIFYVYFVNKNIINKCVIIINYITLNILKYNYYRRNNTKRFYLLI
ncbi:hypothetical protein PFAG_05916 [Plasmodium falciparum Santa Lucia]|uniref:Uncharacterized protein n=5 Tax=Plasmodium falciparum TaxID=5833 RepID=W4IYQ8_PLAFP|nr:hypothetical protein PFNF135_05452 [Plasmodium falciparum NF135/5.C10]ETW54471.1 hypothetical protein PFUGPA_04337 [Plasmodium falciparum Palo Alto/Uganda]EUR62171.1 hypothetical protein PFBG_05885 [Plasmodium falciparum 7G8]EUT78011.1 hypothetical protein PFAG_05916 [Plasmodium falciparum Santa Lucia]EWC75033.1 hypothetical protein C923_04304 [Plasmodium falciparum UGT5.1]